MFNEIRKITSSLEVLSSRQTPIVAHYLLGLMVTMKKHSFEAMAKMAECDPSRFSVLLNAPSSLEKVTQVFNRLLRRRIARMRFKKGKSFILIDATFTKRCSKNVENTHFYHTGSNYVRGHKWINFLLLQGKEVIPLASIPIKSNLNPAPKSNQIPWNLF